jgi:hypothetical protein
LIATSSFSLASRRRPHVAHAAGADAAEQREAIAQHQSRDETRRREPRQRFLENGAVFSRGEDLAELVGERRIGAAELGEQTIPIAFGRIHQGVVRGAQPFPVFSVH